MQLFLEINVIWRVRQSVNNTIEKKLGKSPPKMICSAIFLKIT